MKKGDIKNAPDTLSGAAKEIEDFLAGPVLAINEGVDFKKTWRANRGWERS